MTSETVVGPHGSITTRTAAGANAEDAAGENRAAQAKSSRHSQSLTTETATGPSRAVRPPTVIEPKGKVKYNDGMEH